MKKWIVSLICVFGLSACMQSTVPVQNLPDITFKHLAPVQLNVAKIEIVDQSSAGMAGEHVEHLFPTSPKKAISNWVRDRLNANGTSGLARVTINDASALEEKLKKKTGIKGVFTNDQSERYTTNIDLRLDLFDDSSNLVGYSSAKASRYTTLAEDMSLLEREKAWFELVEKMMADFDEAMVASMNSRGLGQ